MAMFMQYQVGSCWSSVEDNKLAGCLSYYADLKDAAKHAHEVGTGVQPMEVFVDLDHQPEGSLDYLGKPFQMRAMGWTPPHEHLLLRLPAALEQLAR